MPSMYRKRAANASFVRAVKRLRTHHSTLADVAQAIAAYDRKGRIRLQFADAEDRYDIEALQAHNRHVQTLVEEQQGDASERPPPMNVCIMIVGTRGDVQPFIGIAKRLQQDGHRVRLATHAVYREFVMKHGVEFYPLGGDPKELAAYMVKTGGHLIPLKLENLREDVPRNIKMLDEILNSTWPAVSAPDPDGRGPGVPGDAFVAHAIISNPVTYGHIHVAERLGVPLHIMFPQPWVPTTAFPHPMSNLAYDDKPSKTNYLSYKLVDFLMWQGTESMVNRFRSHVLKLRKIRKGDGGRDILLDLAIPHAFMWSPALVPKPADWGDIYDVVGTVTLKQAGSNYQPSPELDTFLSNGDPPIFVGFGSMVLADPLATTKMIIEAAELAHVRVLIQSSWSDMSGDLQVPDNVFFLGECPHDWLMPRVSAVVHHGGAGTTAAGLMAGKPTFIVPFFGDQPFWGRAVATAGVGVEPCPISKLTVKKLRTAFEEMQTPTLRLHAQELGETMLREDGVENAVRSFYRHLPLKNMRCDLDNINLAIKWNHRAHFKVCEGCMNIILQRPDSSPSEFGEYHYVHYGSRGPDTALEGAASGASVFLDELGHGVKDFFVKPIDGYRDEGFKGAVIGFAAGFGGLIFCPIKGAALMADHVATGVYNENRSEGEPKKANVLINNRMLARLGYVVAPDLTTGDMRSGEQNSSGLVKTMDAVVVSLSAGDATVIVTKFREVMNNRESDDERLNFRVTRCFPRVRETDHEKSSKMLESIRKKLKADKSLVYPESILQQLYEDANAESKRQALMLEQVQDEAFPKMNVCLVTTGSWLDDVQPFVAIGLRLKAKGHRIRVATHEKYRDFIVHRGLGFFPLGGDPTTLRRFLLHQYKQKYEIKHNVFSPKHYGLLRDKFPDIKDLRALIFSLWPACTQPDPTNNSAPRFRADAVISNAWLFGIDSVVERLGIPLHCVGTVPMSRTTAFPHVLCPSCEFICPYQYKFANEASFDEAYAMILKGVSDILDNFRSSMNLLGKASKHNLLQEWQIPHSYLWNANVLPKPLEWGSEIAIVGSIDLESETAVNAQVAEFMLGSSRPIIFCSAAWQQDTRLIISELEAAADQANVQFVLQFQDQTEKRKDLYNSVSVLEVDTTVSVNAILPVCAGAVHSGTPYIASACLNAGLPSCTIPRDLMQHFWGQVFARAGVSVLLDSRTISAASLAPMLKQLTTEPMLSSTKQFASTPPDDALDRMVKFFYANLPVAAMTCDLVSSQVARIYDPVNRLKLSYPAHLAIRSVAGHDGMNDIKYKPLKYSGLRAPHFNLRKLERAATSRRLKAKLLLLQSLPATIKPVLERDASSAAIVFEASDDYSAPRIAEINATYDRALAPKPIVKR